LSHNRHARRRNLRASREIELMQGRLGKLTAQRDSRAFASSIRPVTTSRSAWPNTTKPQAI